MSVSRSTAHRPALPRPAARVLTLTGAAVGMWLLGSATASADEPSHRALDVVEVAVASVDQLAPPDSAPVRAVADPVVSAVAPPVAPAVAAPVAAPLAAVVEAATSTVTEVASPVAAPLAPVVEVVAPVAAPVAAIVPRVPDQPAPALPEVVPAAVDEVLDTPAVPTASDPAAATPAPGPSRAAPAPAGIALIAGPSGTAPATRGGAGTGTPADEPTAPQSLPLLPQPGSLPVLPAPASAQAGGGHPLDQQPADLAAAVPAMTAALGAAADDARDSAAAAPFEPSCSPD